jgi:CRISPR-associated protein Cmr1
MAWTTLTLEVTTPLFNGGADPDGQHGFPEETDGGIRVSSIRGAMRFWFRALVGCVTGPDLRLLSRLERRVFGGIVGADQDGEGATQSPLLLRIPRQPPVVPVSGQPSFLPSRGIDLRDRRGDKSRWILYLMGPGLANLSKFELRRPFVEPGETFDLKVGFRHASADPPETRAAIEALAIASLWLSCTYGGVGGRTRRGFGGVRVIAAEGPEKGSDLPLPEPWESPASVLTPSLGHYKTLRALWPSAPPISSCMRYIRTLAGGRAFNARGAWEGAAPSFPVLSRTHAQAATSSRTFSGWEEALIYAGLEFRRFRADTPNPGARYQPPYETHEWAETVHGPDDHFVLGALGLPVVYRDNVVNADQAGETLRRASPLWLRAVGEGGTWQLLSFAFQTQFLGDGPAVHLWRNQNQGRQLHVTDDDVRRQTGRWITDISEGKTFTVEHRRV